MNDRLKRNLLIVFALALCLCLCACKGSTLSQSKDAWTPTIWNCWVCGIYGSSFEVANEIIYIMIEKMIEAGKIILGIGLLFTLLKRVGSMMLFVSEDDMVNIMKETGVIFFKGMFVAILIWDKDAFLNVISNYVIYPVGQFLLMLSNAVLECIPSTGNYFSGIEGISRDMDEIVTVQGKVPMGKTIYGDLGIQVQYIVSRIFSSLKSGIPLVMQMFNGGFMAWILGMVAGWQLFSLMVIFPLAFVDSFLMLSFWIALLPICLALWVFPPTNKYIKQVLPEIVQCFLQILFGCILVVLMITLIQVYADIGLGRILRESVENSDSGIVDAATAMRPNILILLILLISVKKLGGCVGEFASYFTGTKSDTSIYKMMDKVKDIARKIRNAGKEVALAVATGGTSAAAQAAAKAAAKAAAQAAAQAAANNGSDDETSSGGGA